MAQVDYIHFFSNIIWSIILLWIIYIMICVFYVQNIYKVLRLRKLVLNEIFFIIMNKLFIWLNISKLIISIYNNFKNYYFKTITILFIKRKNILKLLCI